jgi:hypothetical protein
MVIIGLVEKYILPIVNSSERMLFQDPLAINPMLST